MRLYLIHVEETSQSVGSDKSYSIAKSLSVLRVVFRLFVYMISSIKERFELQRVIDPVELHILKIC